jgi:hypothetical protein
LTLLSGESRESKKREKNIMKEKSKEYHDGVKIE